MVHFEKNIFYDAPRMQARLQAHNLYALIRSPLAMGLLTGKYDANTAVPLNDIRASQESWMQYFQNAGGGQGTFAGWRAKSHSRRAGVTLGAVADQYSHSRRQNA